jgi:hypothetical protein
LTTPPQTKKKPNNKTPKTDEVNACVLDVGTHSVKAGYAGDDTPKAVFPSACGVVDRGNGGTGAVKKGGAKKGGDDDKEDAAMADAEDAKLKRDVFVGSDGPTFRREGMEVVSPFDAEGQVDDWDLCEALWRHALADRLRVTDLSDMALLVVEPTHASKGSRERCVERLFESVGAPAAYLAKAALLASFATARQTSVVVDSGHMATTGEFCFCLVWFACVRFWFFFAFAPCPRPTRALSLARSLSALVFSLFFPFFPCARAGVSGREAVGLYGLCVRRLLLHTCERGEKGRAERGGFVLCAGARRAASRRPSSSILGQRKKRPRLQRKLPHPQMSSFSMASLRAWICDLSCDPSLVVTEHEMTGRETPHARPRAALLGTKT